MYQDRLNILRGKTLNNCNKKWASKYRQVNKVLDISFGEICWCIGSVYCEMKFKPNILEDVINDTYGAPALVTKYSDSETDEIMLEDESGRVLLSGDLISNEKNNELFITGVVIGVLGQETVDGSFEVLEICYPEPLNVPKSISMGNNNGRGTKVAIVSGLNIDSENFDFKRLNQLQEYLIGDLITNSEIGRLIIAGNSISKAKSPEDFNNDISNKLTIFEKFLTNVCKSIPIDLMPGFNDPSDKSWPQQPINKAIFSNSSEVYFNSEMIVNVTNPCLLYYNGVKFLGTSGENVNDIFKYHIKKNIERINVLEATLKWQDIAPTAPDTLWSYPYEDNNPFLFKSEWPKVYFVGNQPRFMFSKINLSSDPNNKDNEITCICVPEFSSTGEIVILDLDTKDVETVNFD
ncbi:related to DNA polymerase delta small subunit [Saccharomycodes ludwigii]|uniref:DNA-directed DNA polymerase n=2 Tax=Saccharomycodes ludwigii TaxID=36035 RepID=A0A376B9G1_9ASCO|nr:related to DNA polymerase delta small subunit [Saccharomycodes ludwigii]